jgi:hypothetical protein
MSEYESALNRIVQVLTNALLDLGAKPDMVVERLKEVRDDMKIGGSRNGAATIDLLIQSIDSRRG